jgi:hypothetical protein
MSRIRTIIQGRLPSLDAAKVSTAQIELAAVVRLDCDSASVGGRIPERTGDQPPVNSGQS